MRGLADSLAVAMGRPAARVGLALVCALGLTAAAAQERTADPAQPEPDETTTPPTIQRLDASQVSRPQVNSDALDAARTAYFQATRDTAEPAPDDPVIMPVDWNGVRAAAREQQAAAGRQTSLAAVRQNPPVRPQNDDAQAARDSHLPVLIPRESAVGLEDAVVLLFPEPDFYTLSIMGDGILIEVFGTRLAHTRAPTAISQRYFLQRDSEGYRITPAEYGRDLAFTRFGAAYSIAVECDAPETDTRCAGDDYVRNIARSLVIAAGAPREGEE